MTDQELFNQQGYLILRGFFSEEEMRGLDAALKNAKPRFPTTLSKGGLQFTEFVHFHSKPLQDFLSSPKVVDFLKPFIGDDFWLRKDQIVSKSPGGGEFPWHQDNGYNGLREEYFQFWTAVTDMVPENGSLSLIPGTHKSGILTHGLQGTHRTWKGDEKDAVPVKAYRGDVLFFSSMLLHRSGPNITDKNRVAYVAEYLSSKNYDPFVRPPFFQVAKNGRPAPKFIRFYKGSLSLPNRIRYAVPEFKQRRWEMEQFLRKKAQLLLKKT